MILVKMSRFNPVRLLGSGSFSVILIVLTGAYIAVGFTRPWLNDSGVANWPMSGNWIDRTDSQFFNAWPLQILLVLVVANLIVVTWQKIPLTPARYGRWLINVGVILLASGALLHFHFQQRGRVRMYVDADAGPATVDHFYDEDSRSLYVRIGQEDPIEIPLPTLPRFNPYGDSLGNGGVLTSRGLANFAPTLEITDQATGNGRKENLAELIGCKGQQLKFDVVGFYPHANTQTEFSIDPASHISGVEITKENQPGKSWWLVGADPRFRSDNDHFLVDLRHVDADPAMVTELSDAAGKLFHLDVTLPNQPVTPLDVQIGKSYAVGTTGYTLKIERFIPNFPMSGSGEMVSCLTVFVTTPTQTFRRMVLQGKPIQTDFKLGDPADGAMGKRQTSPLDAGLVIDFHVHDPFRLLPEQHAVKHTLLTPAIGTELIDIVAGIGDVASEVKHFATGAGDIEISAPSDPMGAPQAQPSLPGMKIHVERKDHVRAIDTITVAKAQQHDASADTANNDQLVTLKVSMGDWTGMVYAPFAEEAGDRLQPDRWHGGFVLPPGAIAPLQVQLGYTRHPLPARLTLDQFKLIPVDGESPDDPKAAIQDVVSNITLSTSNTEVGSDSEVAKLNQPIYFNNGNWVFSQAGYDLDAHQWTQFRVGNRPAIYIMPAGCTMILLGVVYAIGVKPIVLRRKKGTESAVLINK
jgi:hypothetical protein